MIWTYLRSCFSWTMRLYIGGVVREFPARWFWCLPGAQPFPGVHGCEASPWLKNYEVNKEWGEITPYPTDPLADAIRILDRGENPGYPGLCYVGDRQWFNDGMLPADILDGPIPPFPPCCNPGSTSSTGGLVLGGSAIAGGPVGVVTTGGLALGGSAVASGPAGVFSLGGLVLGGSGVARGPATGGLVVGGTGLPGRGGTVSSPCCPNYLLTSTVYAHFTNLSGCQCLDGLVIALVYDQVNGYWGYSGPGQGGCGPLTVRFSCIVGMSGPVWYLNASCGNGNAEQTIPNASAQCQPLNVVFGPFSWAPFMACCAGSITVTVTENP